MDSQLPQKRTKDASPEIVLTKEQAGLVDDVKVYTAGIKKDLQHAAQRAYLTGAKLVALDDSCKHGEFLKLCDEHLPEVPTSTRYLMINFFKGCQAQISTSRNFRPAELELTNGELPEEHKAKVLAAVYEVSEGKTWTAVAREMGVSKHRTVGREPGEGGRKKLTLKEQAEAAVETSATLWETIDRELGIYGPMFTHLTDLEIEAQLGRLELAVKARNTWLKMKKPRSMEKVKEIQQMFERTHTS